jgi:hypothetical protein
VLMDSDLPVGELRPAIMRVDDSLIPLHNLRKTHKVSMTLTEVTTQLGQSLVVLSLYKFAAPLITGVYVLGFIEVSTVQIRVSHLVTQSVSHNSSLEGGS